MPVRAAELALSGAENDRALGAGPPDPQGAGGPGGAHEPEEDSDPSFDGNPEK
jgi:hypothetical protein